MYELGSEKPKYTQKWFPSMSRNQVLRYHGSQSNSWGKGLTSSQQSGGIQNQIPCSLSFLASVRIPTPAQQSQRARSITLLRHLTSMQHPYTICAIFGQQSDRTVSQSPHAMSQVQAGCGNQREQSNVAAVQNIQWTFGVLD